MAIIVDLQRVSYLRHHGISLVFAKHDLTRKLLFCIFGLYSLHGILIKVRKGLHKIALNSMLRPKKEALAILPDYASPEKIIFCPFAELKFMHQHVLLDIS